ncbi:MAG TPA: biotin synthase BioB [Cyanobacteria bacterium UBA9971]|nr:biotin synthase BioB [Cyanobacteria bacterium UBA9971]
MAVKTNINEFLELYELPLEELIDISSKLTQQNFKNKVDFCSIVSAKTGKCGENCKYCAQSSHYRTNIETHPLISLDEVKKCAISARESGVTKFSIVTSGRKPDSRDFEELLKMMSLLKEMDGFTVCASLGILEEKELLELKKAGLERYHHNINTCKSYHNEVCTTHSYQERINTINLTKKCGLEVCSGVIIGMGESRQQRAEMAAELAELKPVSVPINFLHPIEGTPFEIHTDAIDEEEILRTIAIFRIAMPKTELRYAGGRALRFSPKYQELGLKAGISGVLVGNYLTTIGIEPSDDLNLLKRSGMELKI